MFVGALQRIFNNNDSESLLVVDEVCIDGTKKRRELEAHRWEEQLKEILGGEIGTADLGKGIFVARNPGSKEDLNTRAMNMAQVGEVRGRAFFFKLDSESGEISPVPEEISLPLPPRKEKRKKKKKRPVVVTTRRSSRPRKKNKRYEQ